ncbi:MAG: TlpA disulfide reductase family protein [Candidatus Marinimicrobia bacterium]|jgi:thiol-disulfide isomerase/thioredoxin|nr:TlpA disulfide reductase family protein [Candidatus Neomarinimicrobiota bacterium]MDP7197359.1 TlpA disulfide reductase family protein [SAR202 cluster bacterium]|tara:strand:+ start:1468 stop:2133 length:666 start_codon:yes stop_codon:yes gene_type:complete
MRDFIAHNAKFVVEWGQLVLLILIIFFIVCVYKIVIIQKYPINNLSKWAVSLFCFFFIIFSILGILGLSYEKPHTLTVLNEFEKIKNQKAPSLSFKIILDDEEKNIQDYFGNVILVNFWATWCSPCLKEIPDLNRLQTEFKDKGFILISLSDESRKTLIDFISQNPLVTISGYVENYQWLDINLGSIRPVTFLIDKNGKILEYYTGAYNYDFFKKKIVPLL